jgi:hypothetical protein
MAMRAEIHDLSFFSLKSSVQCGRGEIYMHGDTLRVRSIAQAQQIVVNLSGADAPSVEPYSLKASTVAALMPALKMRVKPLSPLAVCTSELPLDGALVPLANGVGLCANYVDDLEHHERGRLIVNLKNGDAHFHEREFPFVFARWRIAWVDLHGCEVLTLANESA